MAEGFKPCPTCKSKRIPRDWPQCGECHGDWVERDLKADAYDRGERLEMAKNWIKLDYKVEPVADDEIMADLQQGIIKRSRERMLMQFRQELHQANVTRQQHINLVERIRGTN